MTSNSHPPLPSRPALGVKQYSSFGVLTSRPFFTSHGSNGLPSGQPVARLSLKEPSRLLAYLFLVLK